MSTYSPQEHRFRFAAWAAGRAFSRGEPGLNVGRALNALERSGLISVARGLSELPSSEADFDNQHAKWCAEIVNCFIGGISYGRAAKLVNVYLKALFLSDFGRTSAESVEQSQLWARCNFIHPPIDRLLLDRLAKFASEDAREWRKYHDFGWTKFGKLEYDAVIALVKKTTNGDLWRIEEYWPAGREEK